MKFVLLRSSVFVRQARKIIKKQPQLAQNIQQALEMLCVNPFQAKLKTHKLKGELKESYACSAGYDLRIIFKFLEYEQQQAILLESIGTHDEVYYKNCFVKKSIEKSIATATAMSCSQNVNLFWLFIVHYTRRSLFAYFSKLLNLKKYAN